jgi:hypothetical protein
MFLPLMLGLLGLGAVAATSKKSDTPTGPGGSSLWDYFRYYRPEQSAQFGVINLVYNPAGEQFSAQEAISVGIAKGLFVYTPEKGLATIPALFFGNDGVKKPGWILYKRPTDLLPNYSGGVSWAGQSANAVHPQAQAPAQPSPGSPPVGPPQVPIVTPGMPLPTTPGGPPIVVPGGALPITPPTPIVIPPIVIGPTSPPGGSPPGSPAPAGNLGFPGIPTIGPNGQITIPNPLGGPPFVLGPNSAAPATPSTPPAPATPAPAAPAPATPAPAAPAPDSPGTFTIPNPLTGAPVQIQIPPGMKPGDIIQTPIGPITIPGGPSAPATPAPATPAPATPTPATPTPATPATPDDFPTEPPGPGMIWIRNPLTGQGFIRVPNPLGSFPIPGTPGTPATPGTPDNGNPGFQALPPLTQEAVNANRGKLGGVFIMREIAKAEPNPAFKVAINLAALDEYNAQRRIGENSGGTPFTVKEGNIPSIVASDYGGQLTQLRQANVGRSIEKEWKVGTTWLLPLSWDAEAKKLSRVRTA